MEKNQKIIIVALVAIIAVIVVIGVGMYMAESNKPKIVVAESFKLESNESGVVTYISNQSNGYKLEIKEEGNPNGIKKDDMYGSIMKCNVDGKDYVITCYNPVDYSREVSPHSYGLYDVSDIKAYPGVKPVQCVSMNDANIFPSIMTQCNYPYDLKTLHNMNKTGNLNASSIQQYFPPTYTDACKLLKERDDTYLINRYFG
ncbi:hypothetical protein [Methanobrevibacter sp.]|uniref:hypothetical protein n=1 Tax=Methanobrevibacter sp. TaxID=66852 RepID=UPI0025F9CA37|nr:hypothetical protein [Methanobrevibacter sp.]MBQ2665595.1 hypothetical protein [Methanobrevibacter sp.]